ncbi:MAG: hypothetical protein AAF702_08730 [Chloroflexota bacterium]
MISQIAQELRAEVLMPRLNSLTILPLPWLVTLFAILPLIVAAGLTLFALKTGWFMGFVLGLSWLVHLIVFMGLIYWVSRKERTNGIMALLQSPGVEHRI